MQDPRDLIARVEALIEVMLNVVADRATIRDSERHYVAEWKAINGDRRRVPDDQHIDHPSKFASLYEWKAYYDQNLQTHTEGYAYSLQTQCRELGSTEGQQCDARAPEDARADVAQPCALLIIPEGSDKPGSHS